MITPKGDAGSRDGLATFRKHLLWGLAFGLPLAAGALSAATTPRCGSGRCLAGALPPAGGDLADRRRAAKWRSRRRETRDVSGRR